MAHRLPELRPAGMSDDDSDNEFNDDDTKTYSLPSLWYGYDETNDENDDEDDRDDDTGIVSSGPNTEANLPPINFWFLCDSVLPFQIHQEVPQRSACWLEMWFSFENDFECRFDKYTTACIITPKGLEVGPHSVLAFNHFMWGVERQHARGETVNVGRWLYYLQIHLGIYNYNFLIKVRQLVSQHCVNNRIWLRWRVGLSDY